jgi:hypothetical protein
MTGLWKTWMRAWFAAALLFGVVLSLAAVPGADGPARWVLGVLGGDPARSALLDQPEMRFGLGLQGALTLGWMLTLMAAMQGAEAVGPSLWRKIVVGVVVWYVIDSAISVMTGFGLNAVSNTLLMIGFLIPVLGSGVLKAR